MNTKRALLYINLGTPHSPERGDVARYLREFLMDPYVLDMSALSRWLLVNGIIVPFRTKKTSAAYKKIWRSEGSPLRIHSVQLVGKLAAQLQPQYRVELAMRYGEPSIEQKVKDLCLEGYEDIRIFLAYPQYAQSSTETALASVQRAARKYKRSGSSTAFKVIKSYEDHPAFIKSFANRIAREAKSFHPDFYLFSYHGLPKQHLERVPSRFCYRRQCYITSEALVRELNLSRSQFAVGFQSRLSSGWIQPFSDEIYKSLPQKGIRRLLVTCPSFTVDCLETLEEIGLRARSEFINLGGEDLRLVPSLNSDEDWVSGIGSMLKDEQLWVDL